MLNKPLINNRIRAFKVRLIDENHKQIGVIPLEEALRIAQERNLDLIQVTGKIDPPVCKIGDYGKYIYQEEKKQRSAKKQKSTEIKGIRLGFNISQHDIETRTKSVEKFFKSGHKVRLEMKLRGREKALQDHAKEKMREFLEILSVTIPYKVEMDLKKNPGSLSMIISKKDV